MAVNIQTVSNSFVGLNIAIWWQTSLEKWNCQLCYHYVIINLVYPRRKSNKTLWSAGFLSATFLIREFFHSSTDDCIIKQFLPTYLTNYILEYSPWLWPDEHYDFLQLVDCELLSDHIFKQPYLAMLYGSVLHHGVSSYSITFCTDIVD